MVVVSAKLMGDSPENRGAIFRRVSLRSLRQIDVTACKSRKCAIVQLKKGPDTVGQPPCAVTTHNTLRVTRIGLGGNPRGQPPYLMPKGEGTTAWRQSGRRREGAEIVVPQDLHGTVKAELLQAQFQVGLSRPVARAPDDDAAYARDIIGVATMKAGYKRTSAGRTGGNEPSSRNEKAT